MRVRVHSLNHLSQLEDSGQKVTCDHIAYMNPPLLASRMMKWKAEDLKSMIDKGMFHVLNLSDQETGQEREPQECSEEENIMLRMRSHLLALGVSQEAISQKTGMPQQRISEFMDQKRKRCRTDTLDKIIKAFMPELYQRAKYLTSERL